MDVVPIMHRVALKVADRLRRFYWFVRRPRTSGVKCLVEHDGRWLMVRHTYGRRDWTFPGGGIRRREEPSAAAIREIAEEVGIELDAVRPIGHYSSARHHARDTVYCFTATAASSAFRIDGIEIAEAAWIAPSEIPPDHNPALDDILALLDRT